jgi:hypothetical protein
MKSASTLGTTLPALRALGVAAVLGCTAAAATAADATVSITSFTVSAEAFSGNYVVASGQYQSFTMNALEGGGMFGAATDGNSADNWDLGINRTAQTASGTKATGNLVQFTDALTQLTTAGYDVAATAVGAAYPNTTPPNYANATALLQGAFSLIDGAGNPTAGIITFDIYYDLGVSRPAGGTSANYAQTTLSLLSSTDGGQNVSFSDGLLSSNIAGGVGSTSDHRAWIFSLAAGEAANYTLSSSAIAAAVPEPASYAMFALGLAGLGVVARRRRSEG